jgi:Spy/CpxP family protein refolding chaperone
VRKFVASIAASALLFLAVGVSAAPSDSVNWTAKPQTAADSVNWTRGESVNWTAKVNIAADSVNWTRGESVNWT